MKINKQNVTMMLGGSSVAYLHKKGNKVTVYNWINESISKRSISEFHPSTKEEVKKLKSGLYKVRMETGLHYKLSKYKLLNKDKELKTLAKSAGKSDNWQGDGHYIGKRNSLRPRVVGSKRNAIRRATDFLNLFEEIL